MSEHGTGDRMARFWVRVCAICLFLLGGYAEPCAAQIRADADDGENCHADCIELDAILVEESDAEYSVNAREIGGDSPILGLNSLPKQEIHFDEYSSTSTMDRILSRIIGSQVANSGGRLHSQTFSFRGIGAQDIGVTYRGVPINSLSDASADFSFFAPEMIGTARVFNSGATVATGASAGLVEFDASTSNSPLFARILATTLVDAGLFARGQIAPSHGRLSLSVFGDQSKGEFRYTDLQGSSQIRQHNGASRIGGEIAFQYDDSKVRYALFSFFSRIERDEAGVSEFPESYRRATHDQFLALNRFSAQWLPMRVGASFASFEIAGTHRALQRHYENPTAHIGRKSMDSQNLENESAISAKGEFFYADHFSTHLGGQYAFQRVDTTYQSGKLQSKQKHTRHLISIWGEQKASFFDENWELAVSGRVDANVGNEAIGAATFATSYRLPWGISVWGSAAYSQRLPSFDELYYRTEFIRGNPELKPQKSAIHEIGIRYRYRSSIDLKLTGFYNIHRDLIRFVPATASLMLVKNYTHAYARGLEFSGNWEIYAGLGLQLAYALTFAETKSGTDLPNVPRHRADMGAFYRYGIWNIEFHAKYASKMVQNMAATSFWPSRWDLSLEASMQVLPFLSVSLAIYNLLDDDKRQDIMQRPLPGRYGTVSLRIAE